MKTARTLALLSTTFVGFAAIAQEPTDWIDEFPSITEVARAAYEEHQVTAAQRGFDGNDADSIAINLAASLVMLRQIIALKEAEEWFMAAGRKDKLRRLIASYQEAELTLATARSGRNGFIRQTPGDGCGADDECYQRWFLTRLNANSGSAEYRERLLKRLFACSPLATELNDLRQKASNESTMTYFPSPSVTLVIEEAYANGAPKGCAEYGGDTDGDGLCNDWEVSTTARVQPRAMTVGNEPQPCIKLLRVLMADRGGLKIGIASSTVEPGSLVEFRVTRSARAEDQQQQFVWQGTARVCARGNDWDGCPSVTPEGLDQPSAHPSAPENWPLYAVIAQSETEKLTPPPPDDVPETTPLFLSVDTVTVQSAGAVSCEQPTTLWLDRHVNPPSGLHGPYDNARDAVLVDLAGAVAYGLYARQERPMWLWPHFTLNNKAEYGFYVLHKQATGEYYTTPPRVAAGTSVRPTFEPEDYAASMAKAFEGSCEDSPGFKPVVTVHTHPDDSWYEGWTATPIGFSATDFSQAVLSLKTPPTLEFIAMIDRREPCVRIFKPEPDDEPISWFKDKAQVLSGGYYESELYKKYANRVEKTRRCY